MKYGPRLGPEEVFKCTLDKPSIKNVLNIIIREGVEKLFSKTKFKSLVQFLPGYKLCLLKWKKEEKRIRYRSLLGAAADDHTTFVPFAVTATGYISISATRFLCDEVLRATSTGACVHARR